MSNKLATPLGTDNTFFSDEEVAAQGDIKMVGKTIDTLVVEFDQEAYEAYLFSRSRSPVPVLAKGSSFVLPF